MPNLPPPTPEEIARWRELDEKATKGPWFPGIMQQSDVGFEFVSIGPFEEDEHYEDSIGEIFHGNFDAPNNAALIAEYRTALPRLLDEVEGLRNMIREHNARALGCKVEDLDEAMAAHKTEYGIHD